MSSSDGDHPRSSPEKEQAAKPPTSNASPPQEPMKQGVKSDGKKNDDTNAFSIWAVVNLNHTNKLPTKHTPSNYQFNKFVKDWRTQIAAGSSSMLSTFATFPLDLAKSRMQSYNTGFAHTINDVYRAEGFRAFWKGVLPPMCSVTIVRTISFSLYQKSKYKYDSWITQVTGKSPLAIANAPGSMPTLSTIACFSSAGATSGAILTVVSCPFELTKLSEQLAGKEAREPGGSGSTKGSGAWATARRLYYTRGVTGLYAGYRLQLLRDTVGTSIYFGIYESIKQMMANGRGNEPTSPLAVLVAGGACGIASWALIYPIDVAKTKYQKQVLAAGFAPRPKINFFAFESFRGLGVSCLRSCIVNMIFFSSFEFWKKYINRLPIEDDVGD